MARIFGFGRRHEATTAAEPTPQPREATPNSCICTHRRHAANRGGRCGAFMLTNQKLCDSCAAKCEDTSGDG